MRRIQSFKKWSLRFALVAIVIYFIIAMFGDWYTTQYLKQNALKFQRADAAEMVALTPDKAALIAQRKRAELINLIWEKETGKWSPKEGEIAPTFDPNSKQYESCIRIGGHMPKDCISYGPMQEKIGTVQHYAPQVYGRELTEREARDIAEGLQSSQYFFIECAIKVEGCVWNWTSATNNRDYVNSLVSIIRELEAPIE